MNKGLFRLIFSTHLGMFVAASELAQSRAGRSSGSSARRRRRALAASLMAAITSYGALALADAPAGLQPGTATTSGTGSWVGAKIASSSSSQMTILQQQAKAILDWKQLNLTRGQTLTFDQQGNRSWAALNRIYDANPSTISGNVKADGHLYFVNTNGIIFGNGAQINAGSLTATTLDKNIDDLFLNGIHSDPTKAAFTGTGGFVRVEGGQNYIYTDNLPETTGRQWLKSDGSYTPKQEEAAVFNSLGAALQFADSINIRLAAQNGTYKLTSYVLDKNGKSQAFQLDTQTENSAIIKTATGGRVMLLAKNVTNNGVISTPDGQTILAAGEKVYLAKSTDPAGLLVEVDAGGTAINLGEIVAQRGNVTLVGLAVNQDGVITASTSVRANGSIYLKARDTVTREGMVTTDPATTMSAQRGGVVTLGKNSSTTIDVETGDKEEALYTQMFDDAGDLKNPSRVKISGGVIDIEGSIIAHGGEVTATAAFNPSLTVDAKTSDSAVGATRIYLGKDALIDVSGIDASAPMSRNQLEIQLFSDQLKDAPLQRGGPLFGQVIYVDARKGTALTDIQPYLDLKGKTIAEYYTAGGTVNLSADKGDVVLRAGSELNVSGGSVAYEAGYLRESTLSYQGKTVAISQADPNIPYQKLADTYSVTDSKWGVTRTWALNSGSQATLGTQGVYNAAYSAGSDAGTVKVTAVNAVLQADMKAKTSPGITQRKQAPGGGTFNLSMLPAAGLPPTIRVVEKNNGVLPGNFTVISELDNATGKFAAGDALPDALKSEIQLDTKLFDQGFNHVKLKSDNANIIVDAAIKTAPAGSIEIATPSKTSINANITLSGGTVSINPSTTTAVGDVLTPSGDVAIADGVIISTAGLFTNDTPGLADALTAPVVLDGGNVVINGIRGSENSLTLGSGALIDASAGAWLNASGKLAGGKGGNITLNGAGASPQGQVQSYGFSKGGELSLTTMANAQIGGQNPATADTLWLPELFFGQGGFSKYSVTTSATGADLMIGDAHSSDTVIHPVMQTLVARGGVASRANGAAMAEVASPALPAPTARVPVSLAFKSAGALTVAKNATIQTDAPSATDAPSTSAASKKSIALEAGGQLTILGSLIAPAGKISAAISGKIANFPFDNTLSLFVGESARLLATGHYAVPPSNDGNRVNAKVLNGGDITLDGGDRGVVITKQGSLLDVSGVSGQVDIAASNGYTRQTLYGSAGDINILSRNALVLDGDLTGNATGTGAGGTLNLDITGSTSNASSFVHPNDARTLTVTPKKINRAENLNAGNVLDSVIGQGEISAEQITAGGFDRLSLVVGLGVSGDKIVLASSDTNGLTLKLPTALTLDAALLEASGGGSVHVEARHVTLTAGSTAAPAPIAGNTTLEVKADFIDLINSVNVTGVANTTLFALQDIRGRNGGSLVVPGVLELKARQIYPATNSALFFEAIGAGSKIEVKSSGRASTPVLSAGGHLTLKADEIVQGGVLRAPLGDITLDAANNLTLAAGSLTSVSTGGLLIPYGLTGLGGLDWFTPSGQLVASDSAGITELPEKKINLKSADVNLQAGATVDISGGGDVLAYEFIKGIGGSKDILGQKGVYAVMPTMRDEYAPFDDSYNKININIIDPDKITNPKGTNTITITINTDLKPGDAVYLSAVPGLAAGTYTLLPGRYALLPGAFMVQTGKTQLRQGQSVAQLDGSTLVSGYRTTLADTTTNRDSQWDTFKVTDGSIFRPAAGTISKAPAEYRLTTGNQFFTNLAADAGASVTRLASDAGQLTLNAGTDLTLGASILTTKDSGARGALVDITSGKISVVSAVGADDDTLQLTADSLNKMEAESLLLGGTRTQDADGNGMTIATNASTVTFANDAAHALEVGELIAAASDTLTVNRGAVIRTTENTQATGTTKLHASGDGALLAVSSLNDIEYDRSGVPDSPSKGTLNVIASEKDAAGNVMIPGAKVAAGQSVVLDATKAATLGDDVSIFKKYAKDGTTVINNGSVTLGANSILLGDSGNADGMKVNGAMLKSFGNLSKVSLNSYKNIDIYGPVAFGNKQLDITFNAGGIARHVVAGENTGESEANRAVTLTARNFVLKNSATATFKSPVAVTGSVLNIDAENITLAGGVSTTGTTIGGFDKVNLIADKEAGFIGTGSTTVDASEINVTSTRITAATGTDYKLIASGILNTANVAKPAELADAEGLGAKLTLSAASVTLGGNVELPSGQFTAQATTGNLTVLDGASIKAASVPVKFDKFTEHTPGGSVTLQADAGNVAVVSGSTIDVSGSTGSDAGVLKLISTNGNTSVNGTLKGEAGDGQQAGNFVLDTKTLLDAKSLLDPKPLPNFSDLNTALNNGGFTASRDMRIRSGDVTIAKNDTVTAQQFLLSADTGKIDIAGTVDASGSNGGNIEIYAKSDLTLKAGSKVLARGAGDTVTKGDGKGAGGSVLLSSDIGVIKAEVFEADGVSVTRLANAAQVDVSGDQAGALLGDAGAVTLRASRTGTGAGAGVNVAHEATGAVNGAKEVRLEAVKKYESTLLNAALQNTINTDVGSFMLAASPGLSAYKATLDNKSLVLAPGVEVDSSNGSLSVTADFDLNSKANLAAIDGTLTLRSRDSLDINGSLNDGFAAATPVAALESGKSWTYRLVSGADMGAVNPLVTKAAVLDSSLAAIKALPKTASATIDAVAGVIKVAVPLVGYTLGKAPTIAFTLPSVPTTPVGKVAATSVLNIQSTGEKALVRSNGAAISRDELLPGVSYLARYDASSGKYKLIDTKDVMLASSKLLRTGTGDIRIAAGGDLTLGNDSSVIYTAGHKSDDPKDYTNSTDTTNPDGTITRKAFYGTGGGDVEISVQGNITGALGTGNTQQLVNNWLFREGGGTDNRDLSWWVRPDLFKAGVATFGGGDVTIKADGKITNFSASAATTARYDNYNVVTTKVPDTIDPDTGEVTAVGVVTKVVSAGTGKYSIEGGGDVLIKAGGDIANGVYYAGRGNIVLNAGGSVRKSPSTNGLNNPFGTVLALQDGSAEVSAGNSAFIESVFNPTLFGQATINSSSPQGQNGLNGSSPYFLSYGKDSAFRLSSLTGDVTLGLEKTDNITNRITGLNKVNSQPALEIMPASVEATAFSGNIYVGKLVLAPAAQGNLSLLAAGNVSTLSDGLILVSDADPSLLPGVLNPVAGADNLKDYLSQIRDGHAASPLHAGDDQPISIIAREGSISLLGNQTAVGTSGPGLTSPKAAFIKAGKDITLDAEIQHSGSNDITVIEAGRNFAMPKDPSSIVQLSGPGELLVQAGRNVSLGESQGIVTDANTNNPALSGEGAAITVLAGLGKEGEKLNEYIADYINPTGSGPAVLHDDSSKLAAYRQQTAQAVSAYMRKLSGNDGLSDNDAMTQYLALDEDRKAVFAYRHFSSELLASGKGFAESKNHNRGDNAIAMLFPAERKYDGDLALFNSQLRTKRGGSIDMLTPGGFVNVGVPTSSGDDIGIVTERDGDIRAFAETGFQVELSRVITQYGSDITVWANNGDIDAGRGSKTAVSVPERVVSTDNDGNTTIEVKGAATGSGIRAQTYDPDGPAGSKQAPGLGSVALIAPRGILNAGEAGIAAGNFLAVATQVLGGSNIQASGSSTGVPLADTGSLAGSLAGVPSGVSDATKTAAEDMARQFAQASTADSFVPSFISVEVIGLGDDEQGTAEKDKK